jgi:cation transport ATPase
VLIALVFAVCTLLHLADWKTWLHRALSFLVLASPSAVLFSALLTHFGAIYSAAKAGILCRRRHAGAFQPVPDVCLQQNRDRD